MFPAPERDGQLEVVDLESGLDEASIVDRQDSLFREAVRGGHHARASDSKQDSWGRTLTLAFQCVGILYGDIGTSPLYVYSTTFDYGIGHPDDILGVLSLIIYSFMLFTVIKIVFVALHANDDGDGGTFALYSLISRYAKVSLIPNQQAEDQLVSGYNNHGKTSTTLRRAHWLKQWLEKSKSAKIWLFLLTILAIAMVISDAVLTPPISVLSAVGGLKAKAPHLTTDQIVWITVAILVVLFAIQRFGTDKVGSSFAPIILLWLLLIGGVGLYNLIKYDVSVLRAFNPKYIIDYFRRNKKDGWVSLGDILLVFTGTEALFANLGYFSIKSIQLSFSFGLLPSILLTYIGQAAYLRKHPEHFADAFYRSTPSALFWPTFILAIAASIIGSQAMISCAFATVSHLQTLSCFPRVRILHTSKRFPGQLYIPEVNLLLCIAACLVTISFKTTTIIGKAHEICVILVMIITTLLMTIVMLLVWKINILWIALFFVIFVPTESIYLSSVLYKFTHGPYVPVAMSAVLMVVMIVWHYVHVKRYKYELKHTTSPNKVKELLECHDLKRVPGVGLFYTELVQGIPPIFPHLIEKIPTIHSVLIFISIKRLHIPHVDTSERFLFRQVEPKVYNVFRCVARYGYRDSLDEAKDFVDALVECLQYYIRDANLYSVDEIQNISYPISRNQSFSRDKPSGRHAIHAEEMITPIQSFSELTTVQNGASNRLPQFQASRMNIAELAKIEEEQRFIQRETEKGVVYILGESEVVARPESSLLKKIVVNYIYSFLRKNFMQGEKMLSIPHGKLLKVGISYEI
ncbi:potassium transporter 21-like [Phragmites australis]|uniref:potassium transporter 21-like n=1 Tax=Phragmites australis TaxID=29695 RepID=UPI002D7756AA|nr:potassium transporter 21-like [Phragmites australis]